MDVRLFRGLHFPIFGFPASREELLRYGLIVLVDVDPYVFGWEQVQWIADLVASGGSILVCGGPNTFGHAIDFKRPLADCLPVRFDAQSVLAAVGREPSLAHGHPITAGIPPRLGRVAKAHRLRAKAGAVCLVNVPGPAAEPLPVLVVGSYQGGHTAVLNAFPDVGHRLEGDFFTSDFYGDLMTQALGWLLHRQGLLTIEEFAAPPRHMTAGQAAKIELRVSPAGGKARAICRCMDQSRQVFQTRGRDRGRPGDCRDHRAAAAGLGGRLSLERRSRAGRTIGSRPRGAFRWPCMRTSTPRSASITASGRWPRKRDACGCVLGKRWTGSAYAATAAGQGLTAAARIFDPAGELVGELPEKPLVADGGGDFPSAEFAWDVPDLGRGEYRIAAELLRAGQVVSEASRRFEVVDRLARPAFSRSSASSAAAGDTPQIPRRSSGVWKTWRPMGSTWRRWAACGRSSPGASRPSAWRC